MSMKPCITVLMSAYNVGEYLEECLDSLLAQTDPNWICYCVDDGSSDRTWEILTDYAQKDSRFIVRTQTNQGFALTLNDLLDSLDKESTSYLFYLDSDDVLHPQAFEVLRYYQEKYHADVVEFLWQKIASNEKVTFKAYHDLSEKTLAVSYLDDMSIFLSRKTCRGAWINKVNKLYVFSKVSDLRFKSLKYDDDFLYETIVAANTANRVCISEPFYFYRTNPTSVTKAFDTQRYQEDGMTRICATYDYFIRGKRVPDRLANEFMTDLALDVWRMILSKPLKRSKGKTRYQRFQCACQMLSTLISEGVFDETLLPFKKRLLIFGVKHELYYLSLLLTRV